jgi:hypothetical protein
MYGTSQHIRLRYKFVKMLKLIQFQYILAGEFFKVKPPRLIIVTIPGHSIVDNNYRLSLFCLVYGNC